MGRRFQETMSQNRFRSLRLLGLFCASGLALAACNSDDATAPPASGGSAGRDGGADSSGQGGASGRASDASPDADATGGTDDGSAGDGGDVDGGSEGDANTPLSPPLDRTVVTTTAAQTQFLYTGTSPVQTGVAPGAIDPLRASGLFGRVIRRDDSAPLSGVTITVVGHPELGQTHTQSDGSYRLVVNGGVIRATLDFALAGYLPGRRDVRVGPLQYASVTDLALIVASTDVSLPIAMGTGGQSGGGARIYQAPAMTDASGTRQLAAYFPPQVTAQAVQPDQSTQPLTTLTMHATEYTVGANGLQAMPADLPGTSAYTYAVELAAEEASHVQFGSPVPIYLDNFLSLPIGTGIPAAFYDRGLALWVAISNGRVIKIGSVTAAKADLIVDSSGTAASDPTLLAMGVTDEERVQLASMYPVGKALWRVPVSHLSLYDFNLGRMPPEGAKPGDPGQPTNSSVVDPCEHPGGSTIECETQTLRETIPVSGTPYELTYRSDNVLGRKATLQIPVTPHTLPGPLQTVEVGITVAGRQFNRVFDPIPDQTMTFTWDGYDAFGRLLQGAQPVRVTVSNGYVATYANTPGFGLPGTGTSTGTTARTLAGLSGSRTYSLATWDERVVGLGGWDLNVHHSFDPVGGMLHLGDGGAPVAGKTLTAVLPILAGTGEFMNQPVPDGTQALVATINPNDVAFGPDGLLYYSEAHCVRRVRRDGAIETYAGKCTAFNGPNPDPSPDGVPALGAGLSMSGIKFGPDGSLYIYDTSVRKVDRSTGILTTVLPVSGFLTDYFWPSFEVGLDGSIYRIEGILQPRVERYGVDGVAQIVAGNGQVSSTSLGTDGPATSATLSSPRAVAANPSGDLFIAEACQVRRVGADGIIRAFAGSNACGNETGDGGLATSAVLKSADNLAIGSDGSVYIASFFGTIRRVDPSGIITTVAGNADGIEDDRAPATGTRLDLTGGAGGVRTTVGDDGSLIFLDKDSLRIRKITSALPGLSGSDVVIASRDGRQLYVFDAAGRHLRTLDALVPTAQPLYKFDYDTQGRLSQVTDRDGNVTALLRDVGGNLTGLKGPFGQTTTVTLDGAGYIRSATNPAGESMTFDYYDGGLMKTKTDPRGQVSSYSYDSDGRLSKDSDPPLAGGSQALTFSPAPGSWTVDKTSALGRKTHYQVQDLGTGDRKRVNTFPDGTIVTRLEETSGTNTTTLADGTVIKETKGPDPRFGMVAPTISTDTTTPGGIVRSEVVTRMAQVSNPNDLLSLTSYAETRTLNGRVYQTTFDPTLRTLTTTTPAARKSFVTLDNHARVASAQIDGLMATQFGYDSRGRLATVTSDTRVTTNGYSTSSGFLTSVTNPLGELTALVPDALGRTKQITYPSPDSSVLGLGYDPNGLLSSVTPPGKPVHNQTFTPVNLLASYQPPVQTDTGTTQTTYAYDVDRALTDVTRPDAVVVHYDYDAAGRLQTIVLPTSTITRTYNPTTGKLATLAGPAGETITFGYDGSLLKTTTLSGPVAGTVNRTYDNDFRVATEAINANAAVSFGYDPDSLLTSAGSLSRTPDPTTGLLTGTTLGAVNDTLSYDTFGALASYAASFNSTALFSENITLRDALGRIKTKTETVQGTTHAYDYGYDVRGRLTDVKIDGVLSAHYDYDANGNRTGKTASGTTTTGTYDTQDRLKTYGATTYTYGANGELKTKSAGGQTTTYTYDALGNLTNVALPGGPTIDYIVDGLGRGVGKKVDGNLVKGFLYENKLRVVAELDASNNVVSTFVYGTKVNVPEYMIKAGGTYRFITDHLGTVRLVVNVSDGTIAQRLDYDEFGFVINNTAPGLQPFGFAGGLFDADSQLVRFGARDYNGQTGRWTSKDPTLWGGMQVNLYMYVGNDPINSKDPAGLAVYQCYDLTGRYAWYPIVGFDHTWIKTDAYEWGSGPMQVADSWFLHNVPMDHRQQYDYNSPSIRCVERQDVSEVCVDNKISHSTDQGIYVPFFNACDDYVYSILHQCMRGL